MGNGVGTTCDVDEALKRVRKKDLPLLRYALTCAAQPELAEALLRRWEACAELAQRGSARE